MTAYYKPTENITLKHFHFWPNMQRPDQRPDQRSEIRDQIIISLKDDDIHQEALKRSWDLETIR